MILKSLTSAWTREHVPSPLALAFLASAGVLVYYWSSKSNDEEGINYDILNTIPTPKGLKPYIGHLLCFDKLTGYKFKEWHQELGPVIRVQLGVQPCILISDPEIAHELLAVNGAVASNRPRFPNINRYYSKGKRGLVFQDDTTYRNHMVASAKAKATSNTAIAQHYAYIQNQGDNMIRNLIELTIRDGHADPSGCLQLNALNYVLNTCLGTQVESLDDPSYEHIMAFNDKALALTDLDNKIPRFLPIFGFLNILNGTHQTYQNFFRKDCEAVLGPLIQQALTPNQDNMIKHMHQHQAETGVEDIDFFIAASDMITAGTDTVTAAGVWFIAILLHHPNVCKKISNEVDAFIREHGRLPLPSERNLLPYFVAVQKECLRYRPFIFLGVPHELQKDVRIRNYLFPKGVPIYPSLYAMHQNPDRYPEPEKFNPERFLGKTGTAAAAGKIEDRDIFMFGFGRRACLGVHAAEATLFCNLTRLFAYCSLKPPSDGTLPDLNYYSRDSVVTIKPKPYKVRFIRRDDCLLPLK